MTLKRLPNPEGAVRLNLSGAEQTPLQYVGLMIIHLEAGQSFEVAPIVGREQAIVVLSGQIRTRAYGVVGSRMSVFEGTPAAVIYLPPNADLTVQAESWVELAIATAPATTSNYPQRLVRPGDVEQETRGSGSTQRFVHHLFEAADQAERLLLVEVITPAGHWSSFPPHKHDEENPPTEAALEELYYYHIQPSDRWALQRVYNHEGLDETLTVSDGEAVLVPRGYHPVAAPPGSQVYYLNVMAGPHRDWYFTVDPDFSDLPGFRR